MIRQLSSRMRARLAGFLGNLSAPLCRRASVFVTEMVYGMLAGGSVMLTEIGRQLSEETSLKHTVKRLSRNLARRELGRVLPSALLAEAAKHIDDDTLLILDPTDIAKSYAKKMEYLATIRDGSSKRLAKGYWMVSVVAARTGKKQLIPVWGEVFSQESPEFISENEEILHAVRKISAATQYRGVWVMDRGGDRGRLFDELLADGGRRHRFIVRLRGDRHLVDTRGKVLSAKDLGQRLALRYGKRIVKDEAKGEKTYRLRFGSARVRLPRHPEVVLWLVAVEGTGSERMLLLTNIPLKRSLKSVWWIVASYLSRWSIEEAFRFIKQAYDLENVRVLTFQRLRNLVRLLMIAVYYIAVLIAAPYQLRLAIVRIVDAGKPLFGMPSMPLYALARGLVTVFQRHPRAVRPPQPQPSHQLRLFAT